jgi:hypothetical protein
MSLHYVPSKPEPALYSMCLHRAGPAFPYSCQKVDLNEMFQEDDDIEDDSLGAECKIGLSAAVRGQSEGFFLQAMFALLTPLSSGARSIPKHSRLYLEKKCRAPLPHDHPALLKTIFGPNFDVRNARTA